MPLALAAQRPSREQNAVSLSLVHTQLRLAGSQVKAGAVVHAPQLATERATPQLSGPLSAPQVALAAEQNAASDCGAQQAPEMHRPLPQLALQSSVPPQPSVNPVPH